MKLLIVGAGRFGQFVKELAQSKYSKIDFLDDNPELGIGKIDDCAKFVKDYDKAVVAIGDNDLRMEFLDKLEKAGFKIATIISDKAYLSPSASIAEGCIIEPMVVIKSNAVIERGVIINAGAAINFNAHVCKGSSLDCNSVVGFDVVVPEKTALLYGQSIIKPEIPEGLEFED